MVVPARNEATRLDATFDALEALLDGEGRTELVFVLDSSSEDDTLGVGARIAGSCPAVRIVVVDSRGKGNAVSAGVRAALGEIVLLADADLSVPPEQFEALIGRASSGALAIASRSVRGSRRMGEPAARFVAGRLFNLAVRWLVLPGIHDTQCGFKAFPREVFVPVFVGLETEGWCFDVELVAQARRMSVDVVEVPVAWRYGHGSKVKLRLDAPHIARDLWRLHRRFGRVRPPQRR